MIAHPNDEPHPPKARALDEALLGLAVASALSIGGLIYVLKNASLWTPANDSTYLALRSAYRVIDFFRLQTLSPVATSTLERQLPSGTERLGIEISLFVTVLSMAGLVTLLLRLFAYIRLYHIVSRSVFAVLLFSAPVCYLMVSWLTWSWPPGGNVPPHGGFFRQHPPFLVFAAENCLSVCAAARVSTISNP